ncbi:MAG: hypothetical protein AAGG44_08035 [Planctomycetota bacterium]
MDSNAPQAFSPTPYLLGIGGAVVGTILGGFLFHLALTQGIYMLALPGAIIGLSCGYASRIRSIALAVVCALIAACTGVYLQWAYFDFVNGEDTIIYLLTHAHQLPVSTLFMYFLGIVFAGWFGLGRPR